MKTLITPQAEDLQTENESDLFMAGHTVPAGTYQMLDWGREV